MRKIAVALALALLRAPSAAVGNGQAPSPDADANTLEVLLGRAGAYSLRFEQRFSNVVTEERYVQEAGSTGRRRRRMSVTARRGTGLAELDVGPRCRRRASSSLTSSSLRAADHDRWLPFRDVFEVDRKPSPRPGRTPEPAVPDAGSTALERRSESWKRARATTSVTSIARSTSPSSRSRSLRSRRQSRFHFSKGKLDPQSVRRPESSTPEDGYADDHSRRGRSRPLRPRPVPDRRADRPHAEERAHRRRCEGACDR